MQFSGAVIRHIRSDADYDDTLEEIERLFASEPGSEDADRLEALVVLAQDYQRAHHPVGPPDMQSAIEFELDRRGFTREVADAHQDVTTVNGIEIVGSASAGCVAETTQRSRTRL